MAEQKPSALLATAEWPRVTTDWGQVIYRPCHLAFLNHFALEVSLDYGIQLGLSLWVKLEIFSVISTHRVDFLFGSNCINLEPPSATPYLLNTFF